MGSFCDEQVQCLDCSHCEDADRIQGKCVECLGDDVLCPDGWILNRGASYFDESTQSDTNCGMVNDYCANDITRCGATSWQEWIQNTYYSQTDCCDDNGNTPLTLNK